MTPVYTLSDRARKSQSEIKVYNLALNKRAFIGRSGSCDITIPKPEVSSRHAVIYHDDGIFWIQDNDSANGTRINGLSVKGRKKLKFNDIIAVANYTFTFVCEYVYGTGDIFYLEISKSEKKPVSTSQVGATELSLLSGGKEIGKKASPKLKKRTKAPKKGDHKKKRNNYLKKIGAGVSEKIKNMDRSRKKNTGLFRQVSLVSMLFHLGVICLLILYVVGSPPPKEIHEIIVNLEKDKTDIDIPEEPKIETAELEIETEALANPRLQNLQTSVSNTVSSIIESANDIDISDLNVDNNLLGRIGNIQLGKGHKGVGNSSYMKRVLKSNGRYKGIDIRLTLIWDDSSDLDLHALTPNNEEIYYSNKESDGGQLDIDKNAGDIVREPVENIIWDKAIDGEYTISVVLFNDRSKRTRVPFKVEFKIFDDVYYYKGTFKKRDGKKELEIITFYCRGGKYLISKTINDMAASEVPEESFDVIED